MYRCPHCGNIFETNQLAQEKYIYNSKDIDGYPCPQDYVLVCPECLHGAKVIWATIEQYPISYKEVDYAYIMNSCDFMSHHHAEFPKEIGSISHRFNRIDFWLSDDLRERLELWENPFTREKEFRQFFTDKDNHYRFCTVDKFSDIQQHGHSIDSWVEAWKKCTDYQTHKN